MGIQKSLRALVWVYSAIFFAARSRAEFSPHPLVVSASQIFASESSTEEVVEYLNQNIDRYTDSRGRVTPELQQALATLEQTIFANANETALIGFQRILARVGGKTYGRLLLPKEELAYWQLNLADKAGEELRRKLLIPQDRAEVLKQFPFAEFHTQKTLSATADVVIIGAGLTGTSVMFHLLDAVKKGLKVIMIDSNLSDAASLRNGGIFENMPDNFLGDYEGLRLERLKYLRLTRPQVIDAELQEMATEQAIWILKWCASNVTLIGRLFEEKGIDAFAGRQWVRKASSASEESAMKAEVKEAQKLGLDFEYWDKEKMWQELKIDAPFGGRMARKSGNYHPGRLVPQLLKLGIEDGVEFHTKTRVTGLEKVGDAYVVETPLGAVRARHVVVGTNGFTRELLPEMASVIHPFQSHLANWEHVNLPSRSDSAQASWTWNLGDGYGHFRWETIYEGADKKLRGMFIIGGGRDLPAPTTVIADLERNAEVFEEIVTNINQVLPTTRGQPPSRFWTGIMGFTPDRLPVVGALDKNLWIAAGYNGYGGSWALRSGFEIAHMVLTGRGSDLYNENYLSPLRFFNGTALNPLGRPFTNDDPCAVALSKEKGAKP